MIGRKYDPTVLCASCKHVEINNTDRYYCEFLGGRVTVVLIKITLLKNCDYK
jgi:hypothetical protein